MEIRLITQNEYIHVENLLDVIKEILDTFMEGKELSALRDGPKPNMEGITSNAKKFKCDQCNFETKYSSTLKNHKSSLHIKTPPLRQKTIDPTSDNKKSRKRSLVRFQCKQCGRILECNDSLNTHMERIHRLTAENSNIYFSPSKQARTQ